MFRKSHFVFWVQTDEGLILQNVNTNIYIELNHIQEKVWSFLDGTFTAEMIIDKLIHQKIGIPNDEVSEIVQSTIELLIYYDLINK